MRIRLKPGAKGHVQSPEPKVPATQTEVPEPPGCLASASACPSVYLEGSGESSRGSLGTAVTRWPLMHRLTHACIRSGVDEVPTLFQAPGTLACSQ